jgi:hypothetical protein
MLMLCYLTYTVGRNCRIVHRASNISNSAIRCHINHMKERPVWHSDCKLDSVPRKIRMRNYSYLSSGKALPRLATQRA